MNGLHAMGGGLAGSVALTLLHETARRFVPLAPRMDVLGMRAIVKSMRKADMNPPKGNKLYWVAMAGDIISNAAYYSLAGAGKNKNVWLRGALLGAGAGLGAVLLPKPLGLGAEPSARSVPTQTMTIGWYLVGGLAASAAIILFNNLRKSE